ncbi:MAG: hypothetical protein J7M29_05340 [Verrucomicrobia bacterium]|nr:hypothetical protein [Verrucomicrobiota bacterium]
MRGANQGLEIPGRRFRSRLILSADAALVNTVIVAAPDPERTAWAFKLAVEARRETYEAGLAEWLPVASAASPLTAFLEQPPLAQRDS